MPARDRQTVKVATSVRFSKTALQEAVDAYRNFVGAADQEKDFYGRFCGAMFARVLVALGFSD